VKTIDVDERRARLVVRHALDGSARSVQDAVASVVGFHSSDPATVFLSARARVAGFETPDLEDALYERRSLVRMIGMRRTLFVVPRATAAAMDEACAKPLAARERTRLVRMLDEQGLAARGSAARWLDGVLSDTLEALEQRGVASARELSKDVPALTTKVRFGEGSRWAADVGMSTRVLFLLATEGRIVRARPLGSWISGQYRWARTETWLGASLDRLDRDEACSQLLERYLRACGPATMTDIRWWTGWTVVTVKATLARLEAEEVALDEGPAFVLPDDVDRVERRSPSVAFLPGLDVTVMGWKERAWYLGSHGARLFDRAGNAGPTIWADGRIVGGWAQTARGTIEIELLEPIGASLAKRIERERRQLQDWLGDVRVTPRFRTPLERELASRG
jgi:hypothetical protein